ncbi:MAG: hypothetical protein MUP85_12405 [Candidatus Lokiarchaeota archaeon]|nr:hypothetical protein [Candidatus Lokiarchaeota archaeon]
MNTINEKRIKGIVSFVIGLVIIFYFIPLSSFSLFSYLFMFPNHYLIKLFFDLRWYLFLDLLVLAITLFLYTFFIIKPIKTLKGRKNLVIVALIFGVVVVVSPLFGIVLMSFTLFEGFLANFILGMFIYLLFLIPGIIYFKYANFLRENLILPSAK